jgi:acyl-CoA reductase-like NAD-dependent aldehyde dehydrogenase
VEAVRAAIDAAREAFDKNVSNWMHSYDLREQVLFRTAQLIRDNANRLSQVAGRELGYYGLEDFIEAKQILTNGTGLAMKPPYDQVIKE